MATEKLAKLFHGIGIHPVDGDIAATDGGSKPVALLLCAGGYNYFREHVRILGALVGHYCAHTAGSDNQNFSHLYMI